MASAGTGGSLPPNFMLTPQQQSLLFAALNSNKPQASRLSEKPSPAFSPSASLKSSLVKSPNNSTVIQESPFLDSYDYDFGDSSFDFSFADGEQGRMIGDLPETVRSESTGDNEISEVTEKRSHPDDEEDDEDIGKGPKRRESTEKVPKKPGRKPLTSEPSSVCCVNFSSLGCNSLG
jgi:AP-1-like transcription factor